jgi:hypothetical protein
MSDVVYAAVPNCYESNVKLKQLYSAIKDKYTGIISVVQLLYTVNWPGMELSADELYSLLTVVTHIIIRYVKEKEIEVRERNIQIDKHVLPDAMLYIWSYAHMKLCAIKKYSQVCDFNNWIQILWLNNFTGIATTSHTDINPIIMMAPDSANTSQDVEFIRKLILLESTANVVVEFSIEYISQMSPQLYNTLVINPYESFQRINYRKHPYAESVIKNMIIYPKLPTLRIRFADIEPKKNYEALALEISDIPICV